MQCLYWMLTRSKKVTHLWQIPKALLSCLSAFIQCTKKTTATSKVFGQEIQWHLKKVALWSIWQLPERSRQAHSQSVGLIQREKLHTLIDLLIYLSILDSHSSLIKASINWWNKERVLDTPSYQGPSNPKVYNQWTWGYMTHLPTKSFECHPSNLQKLLT